MIRYLFAIPPFRVRTTQRALHASFAGRSWSPAKFIGKDVVAYRSKFCGSTCCNNCARKRKPLPAGEKGGKRYRVCELCCGKLYIKGLRTKFMSEHEAKEVTINQFKETLENIKTEEIRIGNAVQAKKEAIIEREKQISAKIAELQIPTLTVNRELEQETKEANALRDEDTRKIEEYRSMQHEKERLLEQIEEMYFIRIPLIGNKRMKR